MSTLRVYLRDEIRDLPMSDESRVKIDVSPDGTMLLTRFTVTEESKVNFQTGQTAKGVDVKIELVVGPDGRIRAETVEGEDLALGPGVAPIELHDS